MYVCVYVYMYECAHTHALFFMCINVFHLHVYVVPHACKNLILTQIALN